MDIDIKIKNGDAHMFIGESRIALPDSKVHLCSMDANMLVFRMTLSEKFPGVNFLLRKPELIILRNVINQVLER